MSTVVRAKPRPSAGDLAELLYFTFVPEMFSLGEGAAVTHKCRAVLWDVKDSDTSTDVAAKIIKADRAFREATP